MPIFDSDPPRVSILIEFNKFKRDNPPIIFSIIRFIPKKRKSFFLEIFGNFFKREKRKKNSFVRSPFFKNILKILNWELKLNRGQVKFMMDILILIYF